jgi:hypothetical protein
MDGNLKIDEDIQHLYILDDTGVHDHARVEHGAPPQRQPPLLTLLPSFKTYNALFSSSSLQNRPEAPPTSSLPRAKCSAHSSTRTTRIFLATRVTRCACVVHDT